VTGTTSYNADNEQSTFNGVSLSYDSNGNLTGDGTNTYTWDARNHLTQITQRRTTVGSFVYDGFGRRMSKTISGTTTQFLYDGLNAVQELNGSNGVVANLLTGLRVDEYFTRTDSATSTFLADALGSTSGLVTSNNGPIATNYTYQPFGGTTVGGSANGNSFQLTGRENDGTGLYFYRARYYSPSFQRFIAQDPIGFAGGDADLYGYSLQDPVEGSDPYGLKSTTLSLYIEYGGAITYGKNPDGVSFMTIDIGIGFGGGVRMNPTGTSPGYSPKNGTPRNSCSVGSFGQISAGVNGLNLFNFFYPEWHKLHPGRPTFVRSAITDYWAYYHDSAPAKYSQSERWGFCGRPFWIYFLKVYERAT
jgi:RHS repeat-associated protein